MASFLITNSPTGSYIAQTEVRTKDDKGFVRRKGERVTIETVAADTAHAIVAESLAALLVAEKLTHAPLPPAPVEVPKTITASQLRRQLSADGKVTDPVECTQVKAIIAALPPPMNLDVAAQFEFETEFRRANPLVIQLAHPLGYDTPAKLDAFFIAAAKL